MIVLLDNQDSFVYNLVDAFADYDTVVYRNTVTADTVLNLSLIHISEPTRHSAISRMPSSA